MQNLTKTIAYAIIVLILFTSSSYATDWYIAQTGGSDAAAGTSGAPWATIGKCATTAVSGDRCLIRSGTYRETVTPTANNVTYAPDTGASVIVSGANVLTSWTVHTGNIFKTTTMNWTLGVGNNQVFVDGQAMNLARWPNASLDLSHPTFATADSSEPTDFVEGEFFPWVINDSALPGINWTGAEVTLMAAGMYSQAGTVTASSSGHLEFQNLHGGQSRPMESPYGQQYPYYLSNLLGALDTAGEWYFDGTTLYLWTPAGDNPSGHVVEAKRRQFAFDLSNRSNITIRNITIFAASIDMNSSSSGNTIDGITATYVWHQLRNVPPTSGLALTQTDAKWGAWNTGIRLAGSNNVLKNCTIAFSSGNGVYLRGTQQTVDNCTIHDVAYIKTEGGAVSWMGDDPSGSSPGCTGHIVQNNTMYNSGRYLWNYYYCPNFTFTHNLLYNACIQVGDCGFTYTSKGGTSGTVSYNIMHDNAADYWVFGIYMDATPQNYTLHHNVVYNVPGGIGINIGEPATNINLYNNTVWNVGADLGIANAGSMSGGHTYNNLVLSGIAGNDQQNNLATSNPLFVNAAAGNFQLQSGSAAINTGRPITGITDGFVGSAPDIGAYEFGTTAWTAGAASPASTDPIGWWRFDEGTGTNAADSSGQGHPGTLNGPVWVGGRVGSFAVQFDGLNDVVSLPTAILSSFASDHSICLWAQTTANNAFGAGGLNQTLVQLRQDASNGVRLVVVPDSSPVGTWAVSEVAGGTTVSQQTTTQAFVNESWVHLCYTRAAGTMALYTNGAAQTLTAPPTTYGLGDSSYLGARTLTTGTLSGRLDHVKVWNRALNAAEVQAEAGLFSAPRHRVVVR